MLAECHLWQCITGQERTGLGGREGGREGRRGGEREVLDCALCREEVSGEDMDESQT